MKEEQLENEYCMWIACRYMNVKEVMCSYSMLIRRTWEAKHLTCENESYVSFPRLFLICIPSFFLIHYIPFQSFVFQYMHASCTSGRISCQHMENEEKVDQQMNYDYNFYDVLKVVRFYFHVVKSIFSGSFFNMYYSCRRLCEQKCIEF